MEFNFRDLRAETKGWEFLGWKKNQLFFFFFFRSRRLGRGNAFAHCFGAVWSGGARQLATKSQYRTSSLSLSLSVARGRIILKSVWFASTMTATPTQVGQLEIESINWGSQWPTYDRHPTFFFFSFFFFLSSSFLARSFLSPLTLPSSAVFFRAPIESGSTPLAGSGTSHRAVSATDFSRLSTAFFRTPSISEYRVGDGESIRQLFIDAYLYGPVARSELRIELE